MDEVVGMLLSAADNEFVGPWLTSATDISAPKLDSSLLKLDMTRKYPAKIGARLGKGPLGYGWISPWW